MNKLQKYINDFFVNSDGFNGIPYSTLKELSKIDDEAFITELVKGVQEDTISIQGDINPHIIRLAHYSNDVQLELLKSEDVKYTCLYPTIDHIKKYRNFEEFKDKPFTKKLAEATPQLQPIFFEMDILERYANDPRYFFEIKGYSGTLYYDEEQLSETLTDNIFLQSFGIGHTTKNQRRVVCVFLRYLSDLPIEHQIFWNSKVVREDCMPFRFYYLNLALGAWQFCETQFTAFIKYQKEINELSKLVFGTNIFRKTFDKETPREFTFLLNPTQKNFDDFVLLLDKMISDNINKKFFKGKIELEREETMKDGRVKVSYKGTLLLLEEWLKDILNKENASDIETMIINPLKKVRKLRQNPAHKITTNKYDAGLIDKQSDLLSLVLNSFFNIHIIFLKHPKARNYVSKINNENEEIYKI